MEINFREQNAINTLANFFNKENESISDNKSVLIRIICITQFIFGGLCDVIIPKDTIFVRTCKGNRGGGGGCHYDSFFKSRTTYCNLSPLSNLNIQNVSSTQKNKNDHVIFLRTKKEIKFFNFNLVSQLIGAQVKMGERPSKEYGGGRGFFGSCCIIKDMEDVCNKFGYEGVVQCDIADAYYLREKDNPNEILLPESMKNESTGRQYANNLVIEALKQKKAYPIYNINGLVEGAMFPEFNFHLKNENMTNIFDLIIAAENKFNEIDLILCNISDNPVFTDPNEALKKKLLFLTDFLADSDVPNNSMTFKYSWDLNILCKNIYEDYFNLNFDLYIIDKTKSVPWIGKGLNDSNNFYVNDIIRNRCLRLFKFEYNALPYLSSNTEYIYWLEKFVELMKSNEKLDPPCGNIFALKTFPQSIMHPSVVHQQSIMPPSVMHQQSIMPPSVMHQQSVMHPSATVTYGGGNKKKKRTKKKKQRKKKNSKKKRHFKS